MLCLCLGGVDTEEHTVPQATHAEKFVRSCDMKKPPGDPDMLPLVRLTKQINAEIHHDIAARELERLHCGLAA